MLRRRLIAAAAVGILLLPSPDARARQPAKVYRVGVLESIPAERNVANLDGLRRGLREFGYIEGRNLVIEYRSADGQAERFPELAADLARRKVDVIVARGTPATIAARNATGTIPVVMATMGDPRLNVSSFARPGGNVTGVTTFSTELTAKRIEILKECVPGLSRIALVHNMGNVAVPPEWDETRKAAAVLGIEARLFDVRSGGDLRDAFVIAEREQVQALIIGADGVTQVHGNEIVALAARHRLPAVYPDREFVALGGLLAYAINYPDLYFRMARYVDRILKGATAGDLPVEQPSKFELVINLKTANALGLRIPPLLVMRADEVIQ